MIRVVTILINERCPLRCKHCSFGFQEHYQGTSYRISTADIVRIVQSVDPEIYDFVVFSGGEPSLDPQLIKFGVDVCESAGLKSGIVTAPIWAATEIDAQNFLDKIAGLKLLILSYDIYHLEFLQWKHYDNAVRVAASRGLQIGVNITYSTPSEKDYLVASLGTLSSQVNINAVPTVSVGNASSPTRFDIQYVTINSVDDLDLLTRGCILGNAYVDKKLHVYGCCYSTLGEASPFHYHKNGTPLEQAFEEMENDPVFKAVAQRGFLDSLSPEGKRLLFDRVKGQRFATECDLCINTMKPGSEPVWRQCETHAGTVPDLGRAVKTSQ